MLSLPRAQSCCSWFCLPANPAWLKCLEPCIHEDLWITIVSTDFFFPPQFIKHPVKIQRLICSAHPPSLPHFCEAPKECYCAEWPHAGFLRTVILLSGGRLQRPWQNYQNVCLQETIKQSLNSFSPPLILPFSPTSQPFFKLWSCTLVSTHSSYDGFGFVSLF